MIYTVCDLKIKRCRILSNENGLLLPKTVNTEVNPRYLFSKLLILWQNYITMTLFLIDKMTDVNLIILCDGCRCSKLMEVYNVTITLLCMYWLKCK